MFPWYLLKLWNSRMFPCMKKLFAFFPDFSISWTPWLRVFVSLKNVLFTSAISSAVHFCLPNPLKFHSYINLSSTFFISQIPTKGTKIITPSMHEKNDGFENMTNSSRSHNYQASYVKLHAYVALVCIFCFPNFKSGPKLHLWLCMKRNMVSRPWSNIAAAYYYQASPV